ncbi:MAG TPA: patatin, partial [Cryomorphaceae bacterium]|nr:patatin [Cryomorphaceae bacterium]
MKRKIRILSIDGGGIRGIIPGMILVSLEKKLQEKTGNPNARIPDFFDFVAGTSTGGILGCALFYPESAGGTKARYQAMDAVNLYLKNGSMIFKRTFWHNVKSLWGILSYKFPTTNLEKALEQYLGEERLSSLLKPSAISSYYIADAQPFFFKQHLAKKDMDYDYLIKDVARGTSAAPTYFESADVKSLANNTYTLIDGGVYVNNPALCAYAETRTMTFEQLCPEVGDELKAKRPTADDMVIFSLGTASSAQKYSYKEIKNWGIVSWIKPLIGVMMSGVSQNVDYQLREIF